MKKMKKIKQNDIIAALERALDGTLAKAAVDQGLIDAAIEQILIDVASDDLTAIEELLRHVPEKQLRGFLSEI